MNQPDPKQKQTTEQVTETTEKNSPAAGNFGDATAAVTKPEGGSEKKTIDYEKTTMEVVDDPNKPSQG